MFDGPAYPAKLKLLLSVSARQAYLNGVTVRLGGMTCTANSTSRRAPVAPVLSLCAILALPSGCAPMPHLAVPAAVISDEWRGDVPAADPAVDRGDFWRAFGSAELSELVARSRTGNADLAGAVARVDRARGQLRQAKAALSPAGGLSIGASGTKTDNSGAARFAYSDAYAQLDVSYDLDLFGRLRAEKRADRARADAALFDQRAIRLVVETEVARAYVRHAALRDRIAILDRALAAGRERDRIVRIRVREGATTVLDRGLNDIEFRGIEAERSRLIEGEARIRNALAVLVGEEAPRFQLGASSLAMLSAPMPVPVQPKQLLFRRPDLAGAEALIRAAEGDVASARAAFMPTIQLSASSLAQAATLTGPVGLTLSAGNSLLAPIFGRSRLKGQLDSISATQREAVANYRATLLNAFREVQDSLVAAEQARRRHRLFEASVRQSAQTSKLARIQYIEGEIDLQAMLEADQGEYDALDAEIQARLELMEASIDLYKAFGGDPSI